MTALAPAEQRAAYDNLAAGYDLLTQAYDYDRWLAVLERLALEHGLSGTRLLDVACGTGSSFLPLLRAGYRVTACDISPKMIALAAEKARGRVTLRVADMRELPRWGAFDLITCLDDSLNHLVEREDVVRALIGMRKNLARSGLLVFDVNAFAAYCQPADHVIMGDDRLVAWRGAAAAVHAPGETGTVLIDVFERSGGDLWIHRTFSQPHRHYPLDELAELVALAGLQIVAVRGQRPGAELDPEPDETYHSKIVLVAAAAAQV